LEHASDWQSGEFPNTQSIKTGNDYAVLVYRDPADQEITSISFNGTSNTMKTANYPPSSSLGAALASINYALLPLTNTIPPNSNLIYSQAKDEWITKELATGISYGYKNTYCFHSDNNDKTITIFDAKTGTETIIAAYPSALITRDSIFTFNGSDQKMYGYSSFNNSVVSEPLFYYSNISSDRIVFNYNRYPAATPDHILYDGNLGQFVPLSLDSQIHGSGIHIVAGMKTALRVSGKGYLFAYNPNAVGNGGVPVVTAFATPNKGQLPLTVQFNAQVTGGNAPLSFNWDFGDGGTSTLQNPAHSFLLPGTYSAEVTVTDTDGDKGKYSLVITIDVPTGTEEKIRSGLAVYPVPAGDRIMIEIPEGLYSGNSFIIRILDLAGKNVYSSKKYDLSGNRLTLNINSLREGVYILEISDRKTSQRVKIVKKR
jgi:PKD repeat protein